jgi:hypothetical protein
MNLDLNLTSLAFEKRYSDGSGVEFGVRLNRGEIEFEHINVACFPAEELDWLIACLNKIKSETPR